jgi:hypothetical protein
MSTNQNYIAKSNNIIHAWSLKMKLKKEIEQIEKELPILAQQRMDALSNFSLFIALNNAYNLAVQRKSIAERKLSNVNQSKPANGYMESYEMTVQIPRVK